MLATIVLIVILGFCIFNLGQKIGYDEGYNNGNNAIIDMIGQTGSIPLKIPNDNVGMNENISWIPIQQICMGGQ